MAKEDVPLMELCRSFIDLLPGASYSRQLRSLLCLCDKC